MKKYIFILIGGLILIGMMGCRKAYEKPISNHRIETNWEDGNGSVIQEQPIFNLDYRDSITPDGKRVYSKNHVFEIVEEAPSFPGGEKKIQEFLNLNLKYPESMVESNIQGRVFCQFIIEKDGSISDIQVVRSIHELLDNEAVRVINLMPNWIPGKQGGVPVKVRFTLPVQFKLQ